MSFDRKNLTFSAPFALAGDGEYVGSAVPARDERPMRWLSVAGRDRRNGSGTTRANRAVPGHPVLSRGLEIPDAHPR
jgi:hypothetical protein